MSMAKYASFTKCLECCEQDTFDYAYFALKPQNMDDAYRALEEYKLIAGSISIIVLFCLVYHCMAANINK